METLTFAIDLFSTWAPWFLVGFFALSLGVFVIVKVSPKVRDHLQVILWRAPFYSSLMPPIIRTRFFHALSLLVGGGVTLLEALPLAAKATQKPFFETRVEQLLRKMHSGISLEKSLAQEAILLNPLHKHLLCVAEKSGEMPNVLKELCRLSQEEMVCKVSTVTGWLEPSLLLVLGGIMGWIAWSIFQPIYDQLGSIGGSL
ncbi:MAG: hypothetical protein GY915_00320 [bacterium]|nr:hypothetical protein [bacterium]